MARPAALGGERIVIVTLSSHKERRQPKKRSKARPQSFMLLRSVFSPRRPHGRPGSVVEGHACTASRRCDAKESPKIIDPSFSPCRRRSATSPKNGARDNQPLPLFLLLYCSR